MRRFARTVVAFAALTGVVTAQRPTLSDNVKGYVRVNAPVVALTNVGVNRRERRAAARTADVDHP